MLLAWVSASPVVDKIIIKLYFVQVCFFTSLATFWRIIMHTEERKFLMTMVAYGVMAFIFGLAASYYCSLLLQKWIVIGVFGFFSYLYICYFRVKHHICTDNTPIVLATTLSVSMNIFVSIMFFLILWLGCLIGVWLTSGFIATAFINFCWPAIAIAVVVLEGCIVLSIEWIHRRMFSIL